ncbi:MAG: 2-amino-4-hydroxy-6-hydroxymethyldihydropteridine diphosphokinase [Candidatus Limnocylindrales bacterium]
MQQHELAFIGLGANVGAPREALERAVSALSALPGCALAGVSRLYRTRPVGPTEQGDFLNAVVALWAPAGATPEAGSMALLVELKGLERAMGRVPRQRWGPREIDLDLLLFGDASVHVEREAMARSVDAQRPGVQWLDVPHASAAERSFVLAPLADLAPELVPPGWGETVAAARARAAGAEGPDAVEPVGAWDFRTSRWRDLEG